MEKVYKDPFNGSLSYNKDVERYERLVRQALEPILKQFCDEGFNPRHFPLMLRSFDVDISCHVLKQALEDRKPKDPKGYLIMFNGDLTDRKIHALKILRSATGFNLQETKNLIDTVTTPGGCISVEADDTVKQLIELGFEVNEIQ